MKDNTMKRLAIFCNIFILISASSANAQLSNPSVINEELNKYEQRITADFDQIMIDKIRFDSETLRDALKIITIKTGVSFEVDGEAEGKVTVFLTNISFFDLLRVILQDNDLAYMKEANSIRILKAERFEIINGYDFEQDMQSEIFNLKFLNGELVLKALDRMKSASGKVFYDKQANRLVVLDIPRVLQTMSDRIRQWDVPTREEVFELKFLPPLDVVSEVEKILTPNIGKVEILSEQKAIRVIDTEENIIDVQNLILGLDRRDRDVEISTKMIQIILSEEYQQGVDWEAIVSGYQSYDFSGFGRDEGSQLLSVGHVNREDYGVLLEALDTVGVIRNILQLKRMVALDETTGVTIEGKKIILNENQKELPREDYDLYKDIKFNLSSTVSEKNINLKVLSQIYINNKPSIDPTSRTSFDVTVKQGDTVVIGGMYKNVVVASMRKVPFFGDLPLVGFAFRNEEAKERKSEVVIFLTPQIVEKKSP